MEGGNRGGRRSSRMEGEGAMERSYTRMEGGGPMEQWVYVVGYHQIWKKRGRKRKVEEERARQGWGYLAMIAGDYVSGEEDDENPDSSKPS
ncbi:hypothetical protein E3N88_12797 [Mikania micrantha]|uniref:Uncharacterized protein n=1 Tax=Mikania micrantha TaxID=192012 RepID=A0A5N6P7U4_9ASTR|nr:hypothetical protein E3N88_12797 [Mikania micrantha]